MKKFIFGALALVLTWPCVAQQYYDIAHAIVQPDVVGSFNRGVREAQERQLRQLAIDQAQQQVEAQERAYNEQLAEYGQLKALSGALMSATDDGQRRTILTNIAAIDPGLAASYMASMHVSMDGPHSSVSYQCKTSAGTSFITTGVPVSGCILAPNQN